MSNEKSAAAAKQPLTIDPKYVGRISGVLLSICLVTALLLGVVNSITKPKIDAIQAEKIRAAMSQVLAADEYLPIQLQKDLQGVQSVSEARAGGGTLGYVVQVTASGSQGEIQMMVGVDMENRVTGVSVIKHSETPNIGTKVVADQSVLDRFIGMDHSYGEITVNSGTNRFDGVSGATVSSRGVAAGVNVALTAAFETASGLVE
jgi:electron transport complex protein RnfG